MEGENGKNVAEANEDIKKELASVCRLRIYVHHHIVSSHPDSHCGDSSLQLMHSSLE